MATAAAAGSFQSPALDGRTAHYFHTWPTSAPACPTRRRCLPAERRPDSTNDDDASPPAERRRSSERGSARGKGGRFPALLALGCSRRRNAAGAHVTPLRHVTFAPLSGSGQHAVSSSSPRPLRKREVAQEGGPPAFSETRLYSPLLCSCASRGSGVCEATEGLSWRTPASAAIAPKGFRYRENL